MDKDTKKVTAEQREIKILVGQAGWKIARERLANRILELQSVADFADLLESGNADKLLIEMKANKRASEVLFDWLRDIEGTASQADENVETVKTGYVKRED